MASLIVPQAAPAIAPETVEKVLLQGDLSQLKPAERLSYYNAVCHSLSLNPLTRPFDYITFKGKTVLYAKRECTEQLRKLYGVSVTIKSRETAEDCYVVTACATLPDGRTDECIGAIALGGLKGEDRANALMKAETKAKRRVTLAICGMAFLDESEAESVPGSSRVRVDYSTGEIVSGTKEAAQAVAQQKLAQIDKDRHAREAAAQVVEPSQVLREELGKALSGVTYEAIPEERPVFDDEPGLQPPHDTELEASLKAFPPKIPSKVKGKLTATQIEVRKWFGPLHEGYTALGKESRYKDILWKWGVEKCTGFAVVNGGPSDQAYQQALECRNYMQIDLQTLKAKLHPEPAA